MYKFSYILGNINGVEEARLECFASKRKKYINKWGTGAANRLRLNAKH